MGIKVNEMPLPKPKKPSKRHLAKMEKLATELRKYLLDSGYLWQDTAIYFNGKRFDAYPVYQGPDGEISKDYRSGWKNINYNNPEFLHVVENVSPKNFFEYGNPDTIAMAFEGPLYEELNDGSYDGHTKPWKVDGDLRKIFAKYGYYYEMGNAWNLSLYEQ